MSFPSINLGGETTLLDLAALYQSASLLVTTDSGPMHIAAAVGTPAIALFGPTDPLRTGPYGKNHTVIRKELSCSPCFLKKCTSMICMNDITVEEVFQAIKKKL
jgi:3-deoxy-D-manno-octulosonic-acid transferase/heptosyltransferase-1